MRILHIGKFFPPDVGGMESFLYALTQAQVENGHMVTVLACKTTTNITNIKTQNLTVERYDIQKNIGGYAPFSLGLLFGIIKHCYFKKSPDIVHVHAPNIAALWVAFLCPQPIILHWHSDVIFPDNTINKGLLYCWRFFEKIILKRAKRIIVTSQNYLKSSLFLQPFKDKCTVIPLALAQEGNIQNNMHTLALNFMQQVKHDKKLNLLAVGRLSHYKGFSVLLNALKLVPDAYLCLVGTGELHEELEQLVNKYKLKERIFFAGNVDDNELKSCYSQCDIFILPSILRSEAFGMVLLEAMRAGKPCIATSVYGSGMSEVVQDGITGLIVPPQDADALASAIKFLMNNDTLRKNMGEMAYNHWKQKYNLHSVTQRIEDIYHASIM